MRKLKLQMDMTIDGFVAGPEGQGDWLVDMNEDEKALALLNQIIDTSDTLLLGRKMTKDFVNHWENVKPDNPEYAFARKMVQTPKIMFSKAVKSVDGENIRVENGPLVETVNQLKAQPGKDILVYGGVTFVSSLLEHHLIDELNFFVHPVTLGKGMQIFAKRTKLSLLNSVACSSGIVFNTYA
jgi:dihydrofolate reductase